jgi:putative ABC transport system permease protein
VEPLAIKLGDGLLRSVSLKLAPEAEEAALDHAREVYAKYSRFPFEYEYMADRVAARYAGEQRLWRIFRISALLALFVSCLGILGLAAFAVETRTREIGIRKVLGANIGRIVGLLSGDFAKWVLLANAVAWPLAYYGTSRWLERFAYRATVGWGMYVAAGAAALALAMITVGVQAFRAARANPVDSLRHE